VEVLVRKAGETKFQSPDGLKLPVFGSYGSKEEKQIMEQIVAYTGISCQQYNQALLEFEEILFVSVLW
jgi:hypothetical protein